MSYLPPVFQILLLVVVLAAGLSDLRSRRIPNWLVLAGLLSGIGLNGFLYGTVGLWIALKGAGLALAIYFPLFALRAMGAGDAKLMAAVGAIVGPGNWLAIFFCSAVLGGIVGLVFVLARKRFRRTLENILFILRELAYLRPPHLGREELKAGHEAAISMPHGAIITLASMLFLIIIAIWAPR
jgi:prepilin peptidase CpaA